MSDQKITGGMIFYPLEYVLDKEDPFKSYVISRDIDDAIVAFTLNPEEKHKIEAAKNAEKSVPMLKKFAERQRSAKNPCFASVENGKRTPDGIFVGEQVSKVEDKDVTFQGGAMKVPSYEGKWASIVRAASDSPRAPVGYGYLEINYTKRMEPETKDLKLRYEEACRVIAFPDKYPGVDLVGVQKHKIEMAAKLRAGRSKMFTGVILHAKNMRTFETFDEQAIRSFIEKAHQAYTKEGVYGGAIIRVRNGLKVLPSLCKSCDSGYDYENKRVRGFSEVYDSFKRFGGGNRTFSEVRKNGYIIDVIPTERFNCGPMGNGAYRKDHDQADSKILKTFVDRDHREDPLADFKKDCSFIYAKVCMRLAESREDIPNLLLSTIHAFSSPIGSILSIDSNGQPTYILEGKDSTSEESKQAAGF